MLYTHVFLQGSRIICSVGIDGLSDVTVLLLIAIYFSIDHRRCMDDDTCYAMLYIAMLYIAMK